MVFGKLPQVCANPETETETNLFPVLESLYSGQFTVIINPVDKTKLSQKIGLFYMWNGKFGMCETICLMSFFFYNF